MAQPKLSERRPDRHGESGDFHPQARRPEARTRARRNKRDDGAR